MPRHIQDEEIVEMIALIEGTGLGVVIRHNLRAMLEELLTLRKKMRANAN